MTGRMDTGSRRGWVPDVSSAAALAEAIEHAFDYRGDVTITTRDGLHRIGYLSNRRSDVAIPFVELLPASGGAAEVIAYADIEGIAFTGRDTAAGNSYAAWRERKQAGREMTERPAGDAPGSGG
jgi:hypothetical protein